MRSDDVSLFGKAAAPMVKRAFDFNSGAGSALIGALGGGGLGLLTHAITPKDEDEDQRKRLLSHVLAGALAGGAAGYGYNTLRRTAKDTGLTEFVSSILDEDKERTLLQKITNPMESTLAYAVSGLNSARLGHQKFSDWLTQHGINTSQHIRVKGYGMKGPGQIIKEIIQMKNSPASEIASLSVTDPKRIKAEKAKELFGRAYENSGRPSIWKQLISRKAREARRGMDQQLFRDIMAWSEGRAAEIFPREFQLPGGTIIPNKNYTDEVAKVVEHGVKHGRNPRRLIRALERQATRGSATKKLVAAGIAGALGLTLHAFGK